MHLLQPSNTWLWQQPEFLNLHSAGLGHIQTWLNVDESDKESDPGLYLSPFTISSRFRECCLHLRLVDTCWQGVVIASANEALPFQPRSFSFVVLDFALDASQHRQALLSEAARVLDYNGWLIVTGIHAMRIWLPWLMLKYRKHIHASSPMALHTAFKYHGINIKQCTSFGTMMPHTKSSSSNWMGGGYACMGRKQPMAQFIQPGKSVLARQTTHIGAISGNRLQNHTETKLSGQSSSR